MDKVYIQGLLQEILNKEFPPGNRRKVNLFIDRINCCCFYCGDGTSDNKKRGNLYFNRLFYICFNCGKKVSFDKVCRDHNQQIDPDRKMEMIEFLDKNVSYKDYSDDIMETSLDGMLDMSEVERIFTDGDYAITDFRPIEEGGLIYNYLINRGIYQQNHRDIYEAKYWYNSDRYESVICLLNRRGDKILGMQLRNIKEGKRRMFKIYNYETLYKWIHGVDEVVDIDINQLVIYNKISYYFNILNIDFSNKITIFEGYLDSLFYPNSIGVVGTHTDFGFLQNNSLDIQFFFDNDSAGHVESEKKIKEGYPVFLWKKLFEDIIKKKSNEDPYKLMHRIGKIKDLNSLSELANDPYKKLNLGNFFSSDLMDIKFIPKKEKRVWKKLGK